VPSCPRACGCRIRSVPPWPRSPRESGAKPWPKSRALLNRTPSWAGTADWLPRSFDGSKCRSYPGRPRITQETEELIVRFARENPTWGYDRIAGALAHVGHHVSDQSVGNALRRHGIAPAPKRSQNTSWKEFIRSHTVLAGADFFAVEVLTWRGLATYYVLFFIQLETRRVLLGGVTQHPTAEWMEQMARNASDEGGGSRAVQYLLHDRDTKFCQGFKRC
jgi:putative transposase